LWPGISAAVFVLLLWFVLPAAVPDAALIGMAGGMVAVAAILIWWVFFSRAPWPERIGAPVLMVVSVIAAGRAVHPSIAGGMMGFLLPIYAIPVLALALVTGVVLARAASATARRAAVAATIMASAAFFLLLRTDGSLGAGSEFRWRWTPTAEERLLATTVPIPPPAATSAEPAAPTAPAVSAPAAAVAAPNLPEAASHAASTAAVASPEWPGFRGPNRDGVVRSTRINTDWAASPPTLLWRQPIGPGWSSFAVQGDLFYTQEQRGDEEIVACYRVSTGEVVWQHRDPVRFWESNGGAGPRATPAIAGGRVYAFGATGILNALDAATGRVLWSRQVATETETETPMWGFSSSPLVVDDVVIVAASGRLAGYDRTSGAPRWMAPRRGGGYSSPHLVAIDDRPQVVLQSGPGVMAVSPADGAVLWQHAWSDSATIVQPAQVPGGDLLINSIVPTGGLGVRRIGVTRSAAGWTTVERWTSTGLKPYFNDFVVHREHAYGFDGAILSCISLADGARVWKGGRYGNGQMVLLAEQDVLLVIAEEGDLAVVSATPGGFKELARMSALDGKTWNHPVVVGNILLVRNGQEVAAYRLPALGAQ
jgi:outer membrane protein assembly factor BamB